MKHIKILHSLILILIFLGACKDQAEGEKTIVSGKIHGLSDQKIYLKELDVNRIYLIDSATTSTTGEFSFTFFPDQTSFYVLNTGNFENIPIIAGSSRQIELQSDTLDLHKYLKISGSEESKLLGRYLKHTRRNENLADSLVDMMKKRRMEFKYESIRNSYGKIFDSIRMDQEEYAREFIRQHPGNLASILVLNQPFGQIPLFSQKDDLEYYMMLDSGLAINYPGNKHTIEHREFVSEIVRLKEEREEALRKLQAGKIIPDVSLPDPIGRKIPLSSLRGKTVLVYFWASWEARTRQTNQKLTDLYDQLNPQGFEVYAISFDKQKSMWQAAIKVDELDWVNVSDLEHRSSPVLSLYQIPDELPFFYLIDEEGKIIYRGDNFNKLVSLLNSQFENH
ncbi:MAG: AhpC/TSA family protein [Bacteroidales bacterium]|nr:AhpC/TSA family protein [Bacteroidales bacterium]MCF8345392.1 AhpC/TSA family protein [Bacteroidales bacterium]MCF8349835.1 AhpC/TSA family protein [Bacteroidales bacterium]MCF8375569.1 AhpC/TSA family protein [Bacteroidales bacterium]MCF8402206.1 AhpC/TSA family protein [Bacteroidales bacterium]